MREETAFTLFPSQNLENKKYNGKTCTNLSSF